MKYLRMVGQLFLILCWTLIITIGVVLIQSRFENEKEEKIIEEPKKAEQQVVISLDKLKSKYQHEIDDYIDQLKLETVDETTLQVSFILKEEKDLSKKIPMLTKISSLIDSAKGREINFKIQFEIQSDSNLKVLVHDCRIDAFSLPDFLIEPLNEMISSSLKNLLEKNNQIQIEALSIVENQIILVGEIPKEVRKVWLED